jgi:hypothetical protein
MIFFGYFGFLLWLGFCAAVATAANTRGRNWSAWFVLALFVTPLLAVCFLLALPVKAPLAPPSLEELRGRVEREHAAVVNDI